MALRQLIATPQAAVEPLRAGKPTQPVAPPQDPDIPRDPVLEPDDGHFPMYEANMDPVHWEQPENGRGP